MTTVLCIDDCPDILEIVRIVCERDGHTFISSTSPSELVPLAIRNKVDVVVLDINMPEISGFDALDALRDHPETGGLPVLFLSALGEGHQRTQGLRRGANDYLAKPFEPDELILRIENLAARGPSSRAERSLEDSLRRLETMLRERGTIRGEIFLGRYQALEVLGEGGSGLVLRGWDPRLKRAVALKTIRTGDFRSSPSSADVLEREAVTIARFSHTHIIQVYDLETSGDQTVIAMEYLKGMSLSHYLAVCGTLGVDDAVALGLAVTRGLAAAHRHGVVHRDVKPSNILLGTDGSIKVADFGLAGLGTASGLQSDGIAGTAGFVPPEVLDGEGHTEAGDFFGLGACLCEALCGTPAFDGKTPLQRLLATVRSEPPAPPSHLPPALTGIVLSLLAKDPTERLSDPQEIERKLIAVTGAEPSWGVQLPEAS